MINEFLRPLEDDERAFNAQKCVVVGMSGGVDSSVAAALLKHQGYKVIGLFMKNWEEEDAFGVCQASKEYADVQKVCEILDIPHYSVDFVKEYREQVFAYFLKEYELGYTPNPDILCNREIKFKVFFDYAMSIGADFLATGHYCQKRLIDGQWHLVEGADFSKAQAYFLYTIKSSILEKVLFPIGHIPKKEVRELARFFGLSTAEKKDSTGICFIGERNFRAFLSQYVQIRPGAFKTLSGEIVGEHQGMAFYTIGQRKGLGLGGQGEPWFVVGKNAALNEVYVERGEFHPSLYSESLMATEASWVAKAPNEGEIFDCEAKVRYRQSSQACEVEILPEGRLKVRFKTPQRAVTPRQSVVFYKGPVCLGGAIISPYS